MALTLPQPDSEDVLGKHDAPTRYVMHTKARGFQPGALAKQSVLDSMAESLSRLGVNHVSMAKRAWCVKLTCIKGGNVLPSLSRS